MKVNYILSILLILILLFVVSGCAVKDCKSDGDCLEESLRNCDRVKGTLPHPYGDRIWEISEWQGNYCKVHYTVETLMKIEKDCFIKKDTILNGTSKLAKTADIMKHLENCGNEIRS